MDPPSARQLSKRLARNATINLVGGILAPAQSLITAPILAHALKVEGRGQLAAVVSPLALVTALAAVGLPEAVTYFVANNRDRSGELLRRGLLLILVPAAIGIALLLALSSWLSAGDPIVQRLIVVSATLVLPALALSVVRAVAAANDRWTTITVERLITSTTVLIPLVILFVRDNLNLVSAVTVSFASMVIGICAYIPLLARQRLVPGTHRSTVRYNTILRYSSGVWLGSVSGAILLRIDQVLLLPLAGAVQLGLYAVAVAISELAVLVNTAVREIIFTHLSSQGSIRADVGEISRISTILVLATSSLIAAFAPLIVPRLFGSEFSDSMPILMILLLAACLANPGSMAGVGLSSSGLPHLRSLALLFACVPNVALLIVLSPSLGAIGAAIATLAGYLTASNIAIALMVKRRGARLADFYKFRSEDWFRTYTLCLWVARAIRGRVVFSAEKLRAGLIRRAASVMPVLFGLRRRSLTGFCPVVVSMTSYGDRLKHVHYTIQSIGAGSDRPTRIILWVSYSDEHLVTRRLRRLQRRGLEIRFTEDYGPHKKYFPYCQSVSALEGYELPLATADDDVLYSKNWLRELIKAADRVAYPVVVAHRAHRMQTDEVGILPYRSWALANGTVEPSYANVATGVGGVLYPVQFVLSVGRLWKADDFIEHAQTADDLWLHSRTVILRIPTQQVAHRPSRVVEHHPGVSSLSDFNVTRGENDVVIANTYTQDMILVIRAGHR